jgi:hypothetical protein
MSKRLNPPCHVQVLAAAKAIVQSKGENDFTIEEVVEWLRIAGSRCARITIVNHVASRCCVNAPGHHAKRYGYFERIGRGKYRIV